MATALGASRIERGAQLVPVFGGPAAVAIRKRRSVSAMAG
jgi:hypothetical protein